jgi:predicted nucleic acid-binding protein
MAAIVDTGYLYALADTRDKNHSTALGVAQTFQELIVLPTVVLPEICYLIGKRMGHRTMRRFLSGVVAGNMRIEQITSKDLLRVVSILDKYADSGVDLVDATIMALSERLGITRILTTDQRHFRLFRPKHCVAFELLP